MKSEAAELENLFVALADRTRLRLLNLMSDRAVCVFDFALALNEPQPKISRHLAFLRRMKIVETIRRGKFVYYQIAAQTDDGRAKVLRETLNCLKTNERATLDRERLQRAVKENDRAALLNSGGSFNEKAADSLPETVSVNNKDNGLAVFLL